MQDSSSYDYTRYVFFGFFIIVALLAFFIIRPFLGAIVSALFVCYVLHPLYRRLNNFVKNENVSAGVMTILTALVILLPIALLSQLVITETLGMYNRLSMDALVAWFSDYFTLEVRDIIANLARQAISFLASLSSSFILSIPQKIMNAFVFILTVFVTFRSGDKIVNGLQAVIPLRGSNKKLLVDRFRQTTDAIIYGVVVVSFLQGIAALIGFMIFGVSSPVLWAFLTFIAALLPAVGPALVWVPIVISKYVQGNMNVVAGLVIYNLIVQNLLLEFGLKMRIIGARGRISPLLVLLGIVGGVMLFGLTGILLGPIVLVIFLELLKMYLGKDAFAC